MSSNIWSRRRIVAFNVSCALLLLTIGAFIKASTDVVPRPLGEIPHVTEGVASTSSPSAVPKLLSDDDSKPQSQEEWTNDFSRYSFTSAQCSAEFSGIYKDLERAVALRRRIGNVTPSDLDLTWKSSGGVRAMIYNQKLHILEYKKSGFSDSRALGILHQIDRALATGPEPLPNIEFSLVVTDYPDEKHDHHTFWSLSRTALDEEIWLMPDFGYWSWPITPIGNYEQVRAEVKANEPGWEKKIPKAVWRGDVKTNKLRNELLRATRGKDWADVQDIRWENSTTIAAGSAASALSMREHCEYQFLLQTEGRSYSGRGKYLLNCASVLIMHKIKWIEAHHSVFVPSGPEQNFVQVERDFSDLETKIEQLLRRPERAQLIAENSAKTFRDRHLTPAAMACYWRQLIRSWSEVSFQPKPWELADGKKKLRGVPFETFVVLALDQADTTCPIWKKLILQC